MMSGVAGESLHRHVRVMHVMGMPVSLHVIAAEPPGVPRMDAVVDRAASDCYERLREVDRIFSPFRRDSDVAQVRSGRRPLAQADPRVSEVMDACRAARLATDGLFDAGEGSGWDPVGYVKGWAVEEVHREHLAVLPQRTGAVVACGLNAGGDMQLSASAEAGWCWRVGIADPFHPGAILGVVEVVDGAVATSGTAEKGDHIRDPRTGAAATTVASATVVAASLTAADVWATAAVVSGIDDLSWISRARIHSGVIVGREGRIRRWAGPVEVTTTPVPVSSRPDGPVTA